MTFRDILHGHRKPEGRGTPSLPPRGSRGDQCRQGVSEKYHADAGTVDARGSRRRRDPARRSRVRSDAREEGNRVVPRGRAERRPTLPRIVSHGGRPRAFRRRALADVTRVARERYFRSNGVRSQALLSHFALQCFNISLCLCRPWPAGRGRAARPGARITLNGGESERIFPRADVYRGAARNFPCGPGAVTLVSLSVPKYAPPPNSNSVGAPGAAIFGRLRRPNLFAWLFFLRPFFLLFAPRSE